MTLIMLQPPQAEPVTLVDMKAWLRDDNSDEDGLITALITSARLALETITAKAFITQTLRVQLDAWPDGSFITLPVAPLQSVQAIGVTMADGTSLPLVPSSFIADNAGASQPRLLMPMNLVKPGIGLGGITIDFIAGYGADGTFVPEPLKLALKLLVAFWFENRADDPAAASHWPDEIARLAAPYRVRRL
jgi:uncharacterized phiE125 gp8 family phage protein